MAAIIVGFLVFVVSTLIFNAIIWMTGQPVFTLLTLGLPAIGGVFTSIYIFLVNHHPDED